MEFNFDEIRCYNNEEVHATLSRLIEEKQFMKVLSTVYPLTPKDVIKKKLMTFTTNLDFQREMVVPFLQYLEANKTIGIYRDWETDRKSTRLNSSHSGESRMPSSA